MLGVNRAAVAAASASASATGQTSAAAVKRSGGSAVVISDSEEGEHVDSDDAGYEESTSSSVRGAEAGISELSSRVCVGGGAGGVCRRTSGRIPGLSTGNETNCRARGYGR